MRLWNFSFFRSISGRTHFPIDQDYLDFQSCATLCIGSSNGRWQPTGFLARIGLTLELAIPRFEPTVGSGPTCVVQRSSRVVPPHRRELGGAAALSGSG